MSLQDLGDHGSPVSFGNLHISQRVGCNAWQSYQILMVKKPFKNMIVMKSEK